jgi:4-aminobutyrate aminotransferase-like enzyme
VPYASYVSLAEKINQRTPGDWAKKTAFFTTGAEAVENAIKIWSSLLANGMYAYTSGEKKP